MNTMGVKDATLISTQAKKHVMGARAVTSGTRKIGMKEQQNNKRNNHIIEYKGKRYTLTQLAEMVGIGKTTLRERLKMGWSIEDAVEKPIRKRTKGWRMSADMTEREDE